MVSGKYKSGRFRKMAVKCPGGEVKTQYKESKPKKAKCGVCGKDLKGVPRETPSKISKLSKTQRRPERPFGGVLCSSCTRKKITDEARKNV